LPLPPHPLAACDGWNYGLGKWAKRNAAAVDYRSMVVGLAKRFAPGCSVVEMRFVADRDEVRRSTSILAVFSLHAIATRFARGVGTGDAAVTADMAAVADVDLAKLGPAGGGVRVGNWAFRG
jgi:hypothetical protein